MNELQYYLKREHGHPMTLTHLTGSRVNVDTGGQVNTGIEYKVQLGVYLPVDIERKVFSAARGGNYPYGDLFDLSSARILIDKNDLPVGFLLNNNDQIVLTDTLQEFKVINITDLHNYEIHCIDMAVEEVKHLERVVV